jgi:hypothetical protein
MRAALEPGAATTPVRSHARMETSMMEDFANHIGGAQRRAQPSRRETLMAGAAAACGVVGVSKVAEAQCRTPNAGPQDALAPRPIVAGQSFLLASRVLGGAREINVWIPPEYDQSHDRYNVVYLLDGGLDQDFPHIAGLGQLGALSGTYDALIIVGVKTSARIHELTPAPSDPRFQHQFPTAGGAQQFRDFLQHDVIAFIEARYRTSARAALIGESLAGLFVVDTFLNQPALFNDYVAVSPSLWWDNQAPSRSAGARLAGRPASDKRLYLTIANEGEATQAGMDALLAALRAAPGQQGRWRFVDRGASETHATILHPSALDALRWLYGHGEPDYGPSPWYYLNNGQPSRP